MIALLASADHGALSRTLWNSAKPQMVSGTVPAAGSWDTLLMDAATARQRRGDAAYKSSIGWLLRDRIFDVEGVEDRAMTPGPRLAIGDPVVLQTGSFAAFT